MIRRAFVVLALVSVLGAVGFAHPPRTLATYSNPTDPDGNLWIGSLAGKPVNGYSYNDPDGGHPRRWDPGTSTYIDTVGMGQGIAYGKVDNNIVLFYPYHAISGNPTSYIGRFVYGPNDSIIGYYWGPYGDANGSLCDTYSDGEDWGCSGSDHDLMVIRLYSGNWPANLNRIYKTSASDYWLMTDATSTGLTCAVITSNTVAYTVYRQWQEDQNKTPVTTSGQRIDQTGVSDECQYTTSIIAHDYGNWNNTCPDKNDPDNRCRRDSGSPIIANYNPNTLSGFATAEDGSGHLIVTPFYEGLQAIDGWIRANGGSGATLCKTATC